MIVNNANAAVTHIGWPLKAAHKPKPAKECACPTKEIFKNAPRSTKKKEKVFQNDIREGGY